jgi:hypothetical protein
MYVSLQNDVQFKKDGGFNPWAAFSFDEAGARQFRMLQRTVFHMPGKTYDYLSLVRVYPRLTA